MKFYSDVGRVVACDDDACVIWKGDSWAEGTVVFARELWLEGDEITRAEAVKAGADVENMPDMKALQAKAAEGYDPNFDAKAIMASMGIE